MNSIERDEALMKALISLQQEVEIWRSAARYEPKMNGIKFIGWDYSRLNRCRKQFVEKGKNIVK